MIGDGFSRKQVSAIPPKTTKTMMITQIGFVIDLFVLDILPP
jgi:hypothetical protein